MDLLNISQSHSLAAPAGTETFVRRLGTDLAALDLEVGWVFYTSGASANWKTSGIKCFPIEEIVSLDSKRIDAWRLRPRSLYSFEALITKIRPRIVHFHGLSQTISPDHIRVAREAGCKTIMTYHAPGQSCQRWDLMHNGADLCDGKIKVGRCTSCALRRLGVPAPLASIFSTADFSGTAKFLPGALAHMAERRYGMELFISRWNQAIEALDIVTYHSEWVRQLLLLNGVPESKLFHLPLPPPRPFTGLPRSDLWAHARPHDLRLLYVGRLIDIKGIHILLEAFTRHLSGEKLSLLIIGAAGPAAYESRIRSLVAQDPRVLLVPAQDEDTVLGAMAASDALVVPSLWPETGPYTVLEGLYLGKKIVGSNRAGIAERLQGIRGGFLYDPYNARDLANSIQAALKGDLACDVPFEPKGYEAAYRSALEGLLRLSRREPTLPRNS